MMFGLPLTMPAVTSVFKTVWAVLSFGITIPVGVLLAGWLWFEFAAGQERRAAVTAAVQELVAGGRIAALETRLAALEQLAADEAARASALEQANANFAASLNTTLLNLENANDEIAEMLSRPVSMDCTVDRAFLERLRN